MSNDKHTKEFNRVMTEGFRKSATHAEIESFIMKLSSELTNEVIAKIVAGTGKTYTTNKEIYNYCKKHNIEPDHNPYDNYSQPEIDFKKTIDYSEYKSMQDISIEGRTGFVLSNDPENKKIIVEFDDNDETKTISYEE